MFGRTWKDATATVVMAQHFVSNSGSTSGRPSTTKMVLEVHPIDEPAFRAKVEINHFGIRGEHRRMIPPNEGETLTVKYRPGTDDVKIVLDAAHDRKAQKRRSKDALDDALNAPIGSAAAGASPMTADPVVVQQAPPVISAAQILATGIAGTATVLSVEPMGPAEGHPGTMVGIALHVMLGDDAPYDCASIFRVPDDKVGAVTIDATVPVKANPDNRQMVAIDWDAVSA